MCGSNYTYIPPKVFKGCLSEFWEMLGDLLNPDNFSIFIECVKGCKNSNCVNKCSAFGSHISKMSFEELDKISWAIDSLIIPSNYFLENKHSLLLYGLGDPSLYQWSQFFKNHSVSGTVKLSTDVINEKTGFGTGDYFLKIWNCYTVKDCIKVNNSNYTERQIIVSKKIDWLEMAKVSRGTIFFNSYMPSWSKDYVSAAIFEQGLKNFGINIKPIKTHKIQSGFKIVIESANIKKEKITLIVRRCMQPDSGKVKFDIPLILPESKQFYKYELWKSQHSQSVAKALNKLYKIKTNCEKCTKVVWRAKINL